MKRSTQQAEEEEDEEPHVSTSSFPTLLGIGRERGRLSSSTSKDSRDVSAVRRQIEMKMKMIGSSSAISGRYNIKTTGMAGPRRLRRRTRTKRRETGVLSLGKDTLGYDDTHGRGQGDGPLRRGWGGRRGRRHLLVR